MRFYIEEVLFSLTADCNLRCAHCVTEKSRDALPERLALKFLSECRKYNIERIGFTGGETFLAIDLLYALVKKAVKENMTFDRIMTNGIWWKNKKDLKDSLYRLFKAGYDGGICISIDAFHKQDIRKLCFFIKTVSLIWGRRDVVSIAKVKGARDAETEKKLKRLFDLLDKSLQIDIIKIDLSPIGKASKLKNPWNDRSWFKEDYCKGPGNVLSVLPDGSVKPCCGYAADMEQLTIGNIKYDSVDWIIKNIKKNRFVFTVFNSGLSVIRRRLQKIGIRFPGKTGNHCYFCWYILRNVPRKTLFRCLD